MAGGSKKVPKFTKKQTADAEEATGGKWRAGDQAKSGRAFFRAIDIYNNGLAKHPSNFDLAYNKARLELELSQQPKLVSKLPLTLIQLLQQAVASHRYALRLDKANVDILFNAAQAMTDLAEEIVENAASEEQIIQDSPVVLLREALELLDVCFQHQQALFEEQQSSSSNGIPTEEDGGVSLNVNSEPQAPSNDEPDESETFATIQHPVTPSDLLDTANASLAALTLLVSVDEASSLSTLAKLGDSLATKTIPQCIARLPDNEQAVAGTEATLEAASFVAALSNAEYTSQAIDMPTYLSRMTAFESFELTTNFAAACTYADHLVELTKAVIQASSSKVHLQHGQDAWNAARKAESLYGCALGCRDSPDLTSNRKASLFESRGDVSLLCARLCLPTFGLPEALRASLAEQCEAAQSFYHAAIREYGAFGDDQAVKKASIRFLAARLCAYTYKVLPLPAHLKDTALAELHSHGPLGELVVREMLEEGLFTQNMLTM
ncbi:hypothetical protein MBLNU457_1868t1 [Dothideomycetes sp. NU457]